MQINPQTTINLVTPGDTLKDPFDIQWQANYWWHLTDINAVAAAKWVEQVNPEFLPNWHNYIAVVVSVEAIRNQMIACYLYNGRYMLIARRLSNF
ncbi:hypothetical protein KAR91_73210 [Candidatus Pacearchaeota archaeon]|nr:hypothetical protein [Candidatus Pacearchaeota archaeon]